MYSLTYFGRGEKAKIAYLHVIIMPVVLGLAIKNKDEHRNNRHNNGHVIQH